jgi:hypothetical protein
MNFTTWKEILVKKIFFHGFFKHVQSIMEKIPLNLVFL